MIINKRYLAQYGPLPSQYDYTEIMSYVDLAEHNWLIPVIGQELYDLLQEEVDANALSDENSTLLVEAVWPYLAFAVALEALPLIWAHISEVGVTKGMSDNSQSLTLRDMTYVHQHLRSQVESRKDYLIGWLERHYESFPSYHPRGCSCSRCSKKVSLNAPNPWRQLYRTFQRDVDIR